MINQPQNPGSPGFSFLRPIYEPITCRYSSLSTRNQPAGRCSHFADGTHFNSIRCRFSALSASQSALGLFGYFRISAICWWLCGNSLWLSHCVWSATRSFATNTNPGFRPALKRYLWNSITVKPATGSANGLSPTSWMSACPNSVAIMSQLWTFPSGLG